MVKFGECKRVETENSMLNFYGLDFFILNTCKILLIFFDKSLSLDSYLRPAVQRFLVMKKNFVAIFKRVDFFNLVVTILFTRRESRFEFGLQNALVYGCSFY